MHPANLRCSALRVRRQGLAHLAIVTYMIYIYWCRFLRIELGARSFHHLQEGPAHPRTVSIEVNFAQKGTSTDEVATTHGVLPLLL